MRAGDGLRQELALLRCGAWACAHSCMRARAKPVDGRNGARARLPPPPLRASFERVNPARAVTPLPPPSLQLPRARLASRPQAGGGAAAGGVPGGAGRAGRRAAVGGLRRRAAAGGRRPVSPGRGAVPPAGESAAKRGAGARACTFTRTIGRLAPLPGRWDGGFRPAPARPGPDTTRP